MKFSICLLLCCLCGINASLRKDETNYGNFEKGLIYGMEQVQVQMADTEYTTHEFKFPKRPNKTRIIVGVKHIDYHPTTEIEFVEGWIGDHQMTIRLTAQRHSINSTFVFYSLRTAIKGIKLP
ncbi:uncharacterized protein LOC129574496 [Sitodiplosis mosellana]|uniref:uncharacterized protein LOC129574496 n=1 Tax=Sitodiplosis mosellana TaxID=263140 RepID=UPI002444E1AE|nr:uncharacterized protein LOC129574496 [Sitodiplosis mosellana]